MTSIKNHARGELYEAREQKQQHRPALVAVQSAAVFSCAVVLQLQSEAASRWFVIF